MKAWMSLNFGQILPLTTELAALERLKNRCHRFFSVAIISILFNFARNEDMHNIFDELKLTVEFVINRGTNTYVACRRKLLKQHIVNVFSKQQALDVWTDFFIIFFFSFSPVL